MTHNVEIIFKMRHAIERLNSKCSIERDFSNIFADQCTYYTSPVIPSKLENTSFQH